jgi:hypothetical protein
MICFRIPFEKKLPGVLGYNRSLVRTQKAAPHSSELGFTMATESCVSSIIDSAIAFATVTVAILSIRGERVRAW